MAHNVIFCALLLNFQMPRIPSLKKVLESFFRPRIRFSQKQQQKASETASGYWAYHQRSTSSSSSAVNFLPSFAFFALFLLLISADFTQAQQRQHRHPELRRLQVQPQHENHRGESRSAMWTSKLRQGRRRGK